jgi:hypothetical protein
MLRERKVNIYTCPPAALGWNLQDYRKTDCRECSCAFIGRLTVSLLYLGHHQRVEQRNPLINKGIQWMLTSMSSSNQQ